MITKLLGACIITGAFLIGCGGEVRDQDVQIELTPHQIDIKSKNLRGFSPGDEEYQNFMKTYNLNSRVYSMNAIPNQPPRHRIWLNDYEHRNKDLKYVFYIDVDRDENSGYYNEWIPKVGADYLVEEGIVFKYTGTPGSNEWSWEVIDWSVGNVQDSAFGVDAIFEDYDPSLSYGITLNQDWTYHGFLGYFDRTKVNQETKIIFNEEINREFTTANDDKDIYFHSYKKDYQKLDDSEVYYNYEFSINGAKYYTEGNTLFNGADNKILADNLLYEIREHYAITIIPKSYLEDGDIEMSRVTIRDSSWSELISLNVTVTKSVSDLLKDRLQSLFRVYGIKGSENLRYVAFSIYVSGMLPGLPDEIDDGVAIWDRQTDTFLQLTKFGPLSASRARLEGAATSIKDNLIVKWHKRIDCSRGINDRRTCTVYYEYNLETGVNTHIRTQVPPE